MRRIPALVAVLAIALLMVPTITAAAADGPTVKVSKSQAGTGGSIVVTGAAGSLRRC